jgi:hypothetical protein
VKADHGLRTGAGFDGDHIEAAAGGNDAAGEAETLSDARDVALLLARDGVFRAKMGRVFVGRTRFDLDEGERGAVVANDVDLAPSHRAS